MTKFADLHIHTQYSDSTLSPQDVVTEALERQLSCVAITDHDTVKGVKPTQQAAANSELEVIAAIELSSELQGKDIHILGYFLDCDNEALKSALSKMRSARVKRIQEMIEKLKTFGVNNVGLEDVCALSLDSVGRPHLAAVLKEKGWVSSIPEAFQKYLGEDCPVYVSKYKISPFDAITLIKEAKGLAVMAHPMATSRDELIPSLIEAGLQGIEAYYPNYSDTAIQYYLGIAKKHNLLVTGGSDGHGKAKPNTFIGKMRIPYELVEKMKEACGK